MAASRRNRREDFLLPVTIKAGQLQVRNVLCKVFLPVKATDAPYLDFYPKAKQGEKRRRISKFVLTGKSGNRDALVTRIHAGEVYSRGVSTAYWEKVREDSVSAEPIDLTVTYINASGDYIPPNRCEGTFWLTPCSLLRPVAPIQRSRTGNVKVKAFRKLRFTLINGCKLTFTDHYKHTKTFRT